MNSTVKDETQTTKSAIQTSPAPAVSLAVAKEESQAAPTSGCCCCSVPVCLSFWLLFLMGTSWLMGYAQFRVFQLTAWHGIAISVYSLGCLFVLLTILRQKPGGRWGIQRGVWVFAFGSLLHWVALGFTIHQLYQEVYAPPVVPPATDINTFLKNRRSVDVVRDKIRRQGLESMAVVTIAFVCLQILISAALGNRLVAFRRYLLFALRSTLASALHSV